MKKFVAVFTCGVLLAGVAAFAQEHQLPTPQEEHKWLTHIAGEWDSEGEIPSWEQGKPPTKTKGTESARMVGGFWVHAEAKGDFGGAPFTGMLTLGYDAAAKKYVGTWVDSTSPYLWHYAGTLDDAKKVLTLDTEGPGMDGKPCKFRELLEVKDKDHKQFTSQIQHDGNWVTIMTIKYTRKK